jgi:predicted O-linked N-acetylglucosamine transferase (SPINDLY family)
MSAQPTVFIEATDAHKAGRIDEAIGLYRKVVATEPTNAHARYLLGCIFMDRFLNEEAEALFKEAIALNRHQPSYRGAYGYLLMRLEREEECIETLRTGVSLPTAKLDVYRSFVNALKHFRRNEECLSVLDLVRDKFGASPFLLKHYIEVCAAMSNATRLREEVENGVKQGWINEEYARALNCKAASMEHRPDVAIREAREWYRKAPDRFEAIRTYAEALSDSGFLVESLPCYLQMFELKPDDGDVALRVAGLYFRLERFDEAARFYRLAAQAMPDNKSMYSMLTYALFRTTSDASNAKEMGTAYYFASQSVLLRPDDANTTINLSSVLIKMLRMKEGLWYYKRSVEMNPNINANVSSRLFHLNYSDSTPRDELLEAHRHWNDITRAKVGESRKNFDNTRDPEKRLRLGFISADFMFHPVSYFFLGACRALLKDFDVYLYSHLPVEQEDDLTRQYQCEVTLFRNICGMSDELFQRTAIEDGIDVMIDLSGHTTGNRLVAMARRLAPVQIEWLGYPNTTGLDVMDYRISDPVTEPEGEADKYSSEKILRLNGGFHLYKPSYSIPPESPLPALTTKIITFGSFNNMKKVSVDAIALWCELMKAVPNSRLVLKDRNLEAPSSMSRVKTLFASHGIDFKRITTKGLIKNNFEHMRAYNHVDIALDSFPYTGTTTTCEALVMGCPVVTLAGSSHVSRVSASLLTHVGHPEWIAKTPEEFVQIGCKLASDIDELSKIRSRLRKELYTSPLCDDERMHKELGSAIRQAWREWCAKNPAK